MLRLTISFPDHKFVTTPKDHAPASVDILLEDLGDAHNSK